MYTPATTAYAVSETQCKARHPTGDDVPDMTQDSERVCRSLTPEQRSTRARIAAQAMHAKHDGRVVTAKARATFLARFEREADPDRVLSLEERGRRAEHLRRAHFARLALASSKARRARAAGRVRDEDVST